MQGRMARVNKLVQMTLGELVPGQLRDPRVHAAPLIVVRGAKTSPDLRHAKVFVSITCDDASWASQLRWMDHQIKQRCAAVFDGLDVTRVQIRVRT